MVYYTHTNVRTYSKRILLCPCPSIHKRTNTGTDTGTGTVTGSGTGHHQNNLTNNYVTALNHEHLLIFITWNGMNEIRNTHMNEMNEWIR